MSPHNLGQNTAQKLGAVKHHHESCCAAFWEVKHYSRNNQYLRQARIEIEVKWSQNFTFKDFRLLPHWAWHLRVLGLALCRPWGLQKWHSISLVDGGSDWRYFHVHGTVIIYAIVASDENGIKTVRNQRSRARHGWINEWLWIAVPAVYWNV